MQSSLRRNLIRFTISFGILFIGFLLYLNMASSQFPTGTIVTIKNGEALSAVATDLKAHHLVRSAIIFQVIEILFAGENRLIAGDYYFNYPISTYSVASRVLAGSFDLKSVRVTIPEGSSMKQIATLFAPKLPHFSSVEFMKYYPDKEGYLFPDTYFFTIDATASDVIATMQKNFVEKIATIQDKIIAFGKPQKDVITMASILEEEANNPKDWSIMSGVLWRRLKIDMPLQVDPTLGLGPAYDTYVNKGLPPTPIGNPGLGTIEAAISPATTTYLYYLSDKNGVTHYATTFAQHVANKFKYLK